MVEGATLILRLGDVIDLASEKARLRKEIGRLDTELAKIAAKLANPNFLAKAKAEVVEEQREREADASRDRDRLKAAYERLASDLMVRTGTTVSETGSRLRRPGRAPDRLDEIRRVADNFAVALDRRRGRADRSRRSTGTRSQRSLCRASRTRDRRPKSAPIRSATSAGRRCPGSFIAIPTACC